MKLIFLSSFIDGLINGVSMGSVYALIALGYTMVYGVVKMINFAHGEFIVVGGFTIYGVALLLDKYNIIELNAIGAVICLLCAIIVCVVVSLTSEKLAYKPLRKSSKNRINALITAIGVSYILYGLFNLIYSGKLTPFKFFNFQRVLSKEGYYVTDKTIEMFFLLGVTALCLIILTIFVKKTKLGKAMRAVSENPDAAQLMGINNNSIISLTFAIGAIIAAVSAFLYYTHNSTDMYFYNGTVQIGLVPFAAAVVGGIGSLPGAVIGGFIIGIIRELASAYGLGQWLDVIVYGTLVLVLLIKPAGILGKNIGEKV